MSNGYRNGAFALGLTIGASVVLLIFLFGQKVYDVAKCYQTKECERSATKYEGQDFPSSWWWDWTGRLVTSDDTLAQWIMSFFTIAAVLLVWRTLKATQDMAIETQRMARDAREIGDAQTRAWIGFQKWDIAGRGADGRLEGVMITIFWRNYGQTPGLSAKIVSRISHTTNSEPIFDFDRYVGVETVVPPQIDGFSGLNFDFTPEQIWESARFPIILRSQIRYKITTDGDWHYSAIKLSCLIPWFDGAILSQEWKEALWAKFVTGAPRPRTLSEQLYSDRKLRSQR